MTPREALFQDVPSLLEFSPSDDSDVTDEEWDELQQQIRDIQRALAIGAHEARNYLVRGNRG